ncbi:hypothetical protein JTB14_004389 [Gonioctena quinquepunctata]|nr:hypothetical protein JTB14_004389 [Gonioctena quinquepunctata]
MTKLNIQTSVETATQMMNQILLHHTRVCYAFLACKYIIFLPSQNTPKLVVDIHNTPITYIEQNNEVGTDFDSDDSVNDPNYKDEAQKERLLVQAERDGSDIDNDELEANDDASSNPLNSTKQSSEPKK